MELSRPPAQLPCKQGRAFPQTQQFSACCRPLASVTPCTQGFVTAFVSVPALKRLSVSRPLCPPCSAGQGQVQGFPLPLSGRNGFLEQVGCTEFAPSSGTVFLSPVFPLVGVSEEVCLCFSPAFRNRAV